MDNCIKPTVGTKKVYWNDVKSIIKKINYELFQLIEPMLNKDEYPLYLAGFSWGDLIGDETSQFLPQENGSMIKLAHDKLSPSIKKDLGYGANSSPVGMFFSNNFEWYIDIPEKKLTLPYKIYEPGEFFAYTKILDVKNNFSYAPMGVFKGVAGARSCFMLPPISYKKKLDKMCKYLTIRSKQPNNLYDHFQLFKSILDSPKIDSSWTASILYFSEEWINNIKDNKDWVEVKNYFFRLKSNNSSYRFNTPIYNAAYSLTLEKSNLKPNPYLFDTFKHIINIASQDVPGFSPQTDNSLMPVDLLQDIFVELYGIDYIPTLIAPNHFSLSDKNDYPCYYSMSYPATLSFSPTSVKHTKAAAIKDLIDIHEELKASLSEDNSFCSNTIIHNIFNNVNISFHHSSNLEHESVQSVSELIKNDPRFATSKYSGLLPNIDAPFFKGCIQLQ